MTKIIPFIQIDRGLSLIELLLCMAILSILFIALVPNLHAKLVSYRIESDTNALSTVLRYARNTAVNEQHAVTICPTTDVTFCSANWNSAKMVFIDVNKNGHRDKDEALLALGESTQKRNYLSGLNSSFLFYPDGSAQSAATLIHCPVSRDVMHARAVLITSYGKISLSIDSNGDNIDEDASSLPLHCS